jgi:hypothetical protein
VGRAQIREFGLELARRRGFSDPFSDIPADVPLNPADHDRIKLLVAEWEDGEAVAAHIGYGNDVFCSHDFNRGKKLARSVLDDQNRAWLTAKFGVQFVTLSQLAEKVVI